MGSRADDKLKEIEKLRYGFTILYSRSFPEPVCCNPGKGCAVNGVVLLLVSLPDGGQEIGLPGAGVSLDKGDAVCPGSVPKGCSLLSGSF